MSSYLQALFTSLQTPLSPLRASRGLADIFSCRCI
ncbi:hypothetical protein CGRA01v4_03065 [Colletotrichum graminicola]|nr:hypothetical protein CGRA01v4_03065 [Colletotrichum graminicola]